MLLTYMDNAYEISTKFSVNFRDIFGLYIFRMVRKLMELYFQRYVYY